MGDEYFKRSVGKVGGLAVPVNSVTLSDTVVTLVSGGVNAVTYGTSGNSNDAIIPAPNVAGEIMRVTLNNGTTSVEANFNTDTTGNAFFGTTGSNTIAIASTAGTLVPSFELTSVSTSQWAITAISSSVDWTISSTTGSTGQA
jgi:hypothetical protein